MKCVGGEGGRVGRMGRLWWWWGHKIKNRGCFVDSNSKLYSDHLLLPLHGLKEQQSVCAGSVCVCVCRVVWICAGVCLWQHVYLFESKHEGAIICLLPGNTWKTHASTHSQDTELVKGALT